MQENYQVHYLLYIRDIFKLCNYLLVIKTCVTYVFRSKPHSTYSVQHDTDNLTTF